MATFKPHPSSYRDPSGFLFYANNQLYRQVNQSFQTPFDQFHSGGLSRHLVDAGLLTPYEVVDENLTNDPYWYKTLKPEIIPFISYPYEWSFDMLKEAALTTLKVAREAMNYNMHLKDASAYNLQWHKGQMQFIDTLSFEPYDEKQPWIAYRQFCEHFLAPLALMHYLKEPLQPLQLAYPDGIPLLLAKKLLPVQSKWNLHLFLHIHVGAKMGAKKSAKSTRQVSFSRAKMLRLLQSFEEVIKPLHLHQPSGVWSNYYDEATQRQDYVDEKKKILNEWLSAIHIQSALDAGANEGEFSLLLAQKGIYTISTDFDHFSINTLFQKVNRKEIKNLHPLLFDLANPTPAIGVLNTERTSFLERSKTDLVLALALIHHLAIGRNIDFSKIAILFRSLGKLLLIEFVPKADEKIKVMLHQKRDVYDWYTKEHFLQVFLSHYRLLKEAEVGSSGRTLYLMEPIDAEIR